MRRLEISAAMAAAAFTVVGAVVLLAIPWSSSETCTALDPIGDIGSRCTTSHEYLWDEPLAAVLAIAAAIFVLALAVLGGASAHATTGSRTARGLLWAATLIAVTGVFVSLASVGAMFAPAALAALVASIAALREESNAPQGA